MKTKIDKDGNLVLTIPMSAPGTCKVVEKSGNFLIASSGGVQVVDTPWGQAGCGFNMWIKPDALSSTGKELANRRLEAG